VLGAASSVSAAPGLHQRLCEAAVALLWLLRRRSSTLGRCRSGPTFRARQSELGPRGHARALMEAGAGRVGRRADGPARRRVIAPRSSPASTSARLLAPSGASYRSPTSVRSGARRSPWSYCSCPDWDNLEHCDERLSASRIALRQHCRARWNWRGSGPLMAVRYRQVEVASAKTLGVICRACFSRARGGPRGPRRGSTCVEEQRRECRSLGLCVGREFAGPRRTRVSGRLSHDLPFERTRVR
jgi:hypothetical protein